MGVNKKSGDERLRGGRKWEGKRREERRGEPSCCIFFSHQHFNHSTSTDKGQIESTRTTHTVKYTHIRDISLSLFHSLTHTEREKS